MKGRGRNGDGGRRHPGILALVLVAAVFSCGTAWMSGQGYQAALQRAGEENRKAEEEIRRRETAYQELQQANEELSEANGELTASNRQQAEELVELKDPGNGVRAHGRLSVEGGRLVDEGGEAIVLRGMSSHGLHWYPEYANAAAMATLKEYGANVFRAAMYTWQEGSYAYEPEQNQTYLYMAIENALSQDMYVIADWHVLRDENPLVHVEEAVDFFGELSARYAGEPGVIYEICNEPNGDTPWEDVRAYAGRVIPVIRGNSPDAVILVGTPDYCVDLEAAAEEPLAYENLLYTFHQYLDVSEKGGYDSGILERALQAGLPVFVSEWGISYGGRDDSGISSYQDDSLHFEAVYDFLALLEEWGVSWCGWSLSNKAEATSMILPGCNKLSGWDREDMTPGGWMMAQALRYYGTENE